MCTWIYPGHSLPRLSQGSDASPGRISAVKAMASAASAASVQVGAAAASGQEDEKWEVPLGIPRENIEKDVERLWFSWFL